MRRLPAMLIVLVLFSLTWCEATQAAAEKPAKPAAAPARVTPPVNVNVTVNVKVSHDVNVDVKLEAPITPVIGTLQLPDVVQKLLSSFWSKPAAPAKPEATPAKK